MPLGSRMAQAFTDLMLRKLAPDKTRRTEVWDGKTPGFGLRVSPHGTKTFILVYRHRGRPRRLTIGRYPYLPLADARDKAEAALKLVNSGIDPALAEHPEDDPSFRFDAVVDRFVMRHCRVHNKPSTAKETERLLKKHFVRAWGKRDVRDIRQSHVEEILDALIEANKPSEANHALGVVKTLLQWCVDRTMLEASPALNIKKPAKSRSRARTLTPDELRRLWAVCEAEGFPFGVMTKLLLLTGQRRGEVALMEWSHLDLKARTWSIPAELSKNGREHLVPLSAHAVQLIKPVPRSDSKFVFPARGNASSVFSGFTRAKLRLDRNSAINGWTLHDLRRTAATYLAKLDVAPHVIERILNHVSGSFAGVAGIYNRHPYQDEMRAALEKWAEHLLHIARSRPAGSAPRGSVA